jgi:hypothetical protein
VAFTTALSNLTHKAFVRLTSVHKPLVRLARRRVRAAQRDAIAASAQAVEGEIARIVAGTGPLIAGPWLGEVGYEALYWTAFLRWVQDRYRVAPERVVVVSRGGVEQWYAGLAGRYVDLFDLLSPEELAARNDARLAAEEQGGRKQFRRGALDEWILQQPAVNGGSSAVLHPSLMFRMFRDVWQGNLPLDYLFTRAEFARVPRPSRPALSPLPPSYVAMKFYGGTALPHTPQHADALRRLVAHVARRTPVVSLDTGLEVDDHRDFVFDDIPGVISARGWMTPRTNLGLQSALMAHADYFLGTCGGLAWLAPFMGVPAVAVYADDAFLRPHLTVARQAGLRAGAAEFSVLDLRALGRLNVAWPG